MSLRIIVAKVRLVSGLQRAIEVLLARRPRPVAELDVLQ
jgi:hypothetical protein